VTRRILSFLFPFRDFQPGSTDGDVAATDGSEAAGDSGPGELAWLAVAVGLAAALLGAWLHPMELGGFNTEVDGFVASAEMLWEGSWPRDPFRPLLYPLLAAALSVVMTPFAAARLVSGVASGLFVWASVRLARRAAGREVAIWTGVGLLLTPLVLENSVLATSDMLFAALAVTTLWLAVRVADRPTLGRVIALGAAFAGAYFTRYHAIALAPAVATAVLLDRRVALEGRVVTLLSWGGFAATFLLPHLVLNTLQFGTPFHNATWANLALKLYGSGDWKYLDTVPFDGWHSVLASDPGAVWSGFLLELANLPGSLVELCGGGLAGTVVVVLGMVGTVRHLQRRDRWTLPVLVFAATTAVGVCFTFFAQPRLFLPLLPLLWILAADTMRDLIDHWPARAAAVGLLALLLGSSTVQHLVIFSGRHPIADVEAARDLADSHPGATIATTYYAMESRVEAEVLYLTLPRGPERDDPDLYLSRIAPALTAADFLVVGRHTVGIRPWTLYDGSALPDLLAPMAHREDATVYRIDQADPYCSTLGDRFDDGDLRAGCAGRWVPLHDTTGGTLRLEVDDGALRLTTSGYTDWGSGVGLEIPAPRSPLASRSSSPTGGPIRLAAIVPAATTTRPSCGTSGPSGPPSWSSWPTPAKRAGAHRHRDPTVSGGPRTTVAWIPPRSAPSTGSSVPSTPSCSSTISS
jgi:hypothetical protein